MFIYKPNLIQTPAVWSQTFLWLTSVDQTVLKISMSAMTHRSCSCWHFLILLLSLLLHLNPSLAFSLKNCTLSSLKNMTLVECGNRDLDAVPHDIPEDAVSLVVSRNHIAKINRLDLSSLSKLRNFQAENNLISNIDDGAFSGLDLRQLSLGSNNLTNLTDNIFQGLWKLTRLLMADNYISNISPLAFQSLVSLESLVLINNPICQISAIAPILQLPNFYALLLGSNKLTSFDSDDLPLNQSKVRYLLLAGNPLSKFSIKRDIFPHLQELHLSSDTNFEWDVEDTTFLRNLTTIRLDGFDVSRKLFRKMLKSVESVQKLMMGGMANKNLVDIACQIPSLTTLDLSGNDYVNINDSLLESCSQLIELDLSSNTIEEMSEFSLRSTKQLKYLSLRKNSLLKVPSALRGLHTLEVLDLSLNFIGNLGCSDFFNLTGLMRLNLNQNRISTLNGCAFQDLKVLNVLVIGENKVHRLTDFFKVNLQKLEFLDLQKNDLVHLKRSDFRYLSSLKSLDLESDQVYTIDEGAFEGLDNLQSLSVSPFLYDTMIFRGVNLKRLNDLKLHLRSFDIIKSSNPKNETYFSQFPSLKTLEIQCYDGYHHIAPDLLNGLKSLVYFTAVNFFIDTPHPDTFIGTPDLKGLQITKSGLKEINPKLFQPISKLEALDLSQNKLRSLDFLSKVDLSTLTWLTLRDNELTVINEIVFRSLPSLLYLDLTGNPFICDCSNVGFVEWVRSSIQTQVLNAYQYDCSFPPAKQGSKLMEIDMEFCWTDINLFCFISTTCLVMLTIFTSFIYHFLRWQLAYTFYLFLAFLYDSRKRRNGAPYLYDAFISYNVEDEAWVYREMLPVLEGEQGWKLCLHHRDFQPGKPIIENITDAIYGSRKTICVISQHYLQSEWCSREIQMASFRLFDEQKDVLILLFVEEIQAWQLSPYYRMRKVLKRRSYLSWTQAGQHKGVFWQNVRRALETGDADNTDLLTVPKC